MKFTVDYLIVSLLLMGLGGVLAVARNVNKVLVCLGVGVATPTLISALAKVIKP